MEFVYQIDNHLPETVCDEIIKRFEDDDRKHKCLVGNNGAMNEKVRITTGLSISCIEEWKDIDDILVRNIKDGMKKYKQYLSQLIPPHLAESLFCSLTDYGYEIQRTRQNEFYNWHYDQMIEKTPPKSPGARVITCIWYLNTLDEDDGGCTELGW